MPRILSCRERTQENPPIRHLETCKNRKDKGEENSLLGIGNDEMMEGRNWRMTKPDVGALVASPKESGVLRIGAARGGYASDDRGHMTGR